MKVKDTETGRRSIAHFYRDCEAWPRLDPSIVLSPSPRPIRAEVSKTLFMGGQGQVHLQASLHRLTWIAGQRCSIHLDVSNSSTKTIKKVTISLSRAVVTFQPDSRLNAGVYTIDPDACRTATSEKVVAESVLEMGDNTSRGHASSKGWWCGVGPSQNAIFQHFIHLPVWGFLDNP